MVTTEHDDRDDGGGGGGFRGNLILSRTIKALVINGTFRSPLKKRLRSSSSSSMYRNILMIFTNREKVPSEK
jgi:hypothetical protein